MKKRLLKKAYSKAMKGEHTRIIPKGQYGKRKAIFDQLKIIGYATRQLKKLTKHKFDLTLFIVYVQIISQSAQQLYIIQSQPVPPKHSFAKGNIIHEQGNEMIIHKLNPPLLIGTTINDKPTEVTKDDLGSYTLTIKRDKSCQK